MKIGNYNISRNSRPIIIAEMSGNHNKSLERALKIVELVAKSGAHILKLQTYTADTLTIQSNKDDFVILCGVSNGKVKEYFIVPTLVVDKTLKESNRIYHLGKKRDGSKRKVTSHRAIFLQERKVHYWCG